MATATDHPEQQSKVSDKQNAESNKDAISKLHSEAYANGRDSDATQQGQKADATKLPGLTLTVGGAQNREGFTPFPWDQQPDDGHNKLHMSYEMQRDARVKKGEGPYHVAERLLGKDANAADVKALSNAIIAQFKAEQNDDNALNSVPIGHNIINEKNIGQILDRILDDGCKQRLADRLKLGWNDATQPTAVPFDHDARPGETQPSYIADDKQFLKDIAAAAIDVGAAALRAKGQCAQGARLALNELPNWHIDGGTVDKSINKDPNGWRSGLKMAQDLAGSGLFDVVPLEKLGYKNLKEGYIVGRFHHPDYVKQHPTWEGEDFGDIDIMTKKHRPPNDGDFYMNSFVLIPKKHKA